MGWCFLSRQRSSLTNQPVCKTSPPQEGHINTACSCEGQLPSLRKGHKLSKTLEALPDSFLRPSTRELSMIYKCCNWSSVAKGSINLPCPPQGWCLDVPTYTWTCINPLDSVLEDPHDQEDPKKRTNGMPLNPQGWWPSFYSNLSLCHSFFALSLFFLFSSCSTVHLLLNEIHINDFSIGAPLHINLGGSISHES